MELQLMNEPVRMWYSLDEMKGNARKYLETMFGKPSEAEDQDAWYARFGLLCDFVETMWYEMPPSPPSASVSQEKP